MNYYKWLGQGLLLTGLAGAVHAQGSEVLESAAPLEWNALQVEHLLNRAAFGATTEEVQRWQSEGPEALIEFLLNGGTPVEPFKVKRHRYERRGMFGASEQDKSQERKRVRLLNRAQIEDFSAWWVQRLVRGEDPLRERMTLIFHGWLVSGANKVLQSDYMVLQNQLFRSKALGNYGELLAAIVEDPAMLLYLDNNTNRRAKPNENLARELMELFSLGEGHYSEEDVRQAARALTGYTVGEKGFLFATKQHDSAPVTVLGYTGVMDGQDLVALLLEQPACSQYVATRLIQEFEGVKPDPERLAIYAKILVKGDYEIKPFLRHLFHDPKFYRPEVLGAKVQSPVDFIIGSCRRLQVEPEGEFLTNAVSMLGQTLMNPPSVKGWDGGYAWMTEASSIMRSNIIGAMIGQVSPNDLRAGMEEALERMDEMMGDDKSEDGIEDTPKRRNGPLAKLLYQVKRQKMTVTVPVLDWLITHKASNDMEVARALLDQLLAVTPDPDTERRVVQFLKAGRKQMNIKEGKWVKNPEKSRMLLMQTVHLILSLPEANLE